jgi:hypothetical protein
MRLKSFLLVCLVVSVWVNDAGAQSAPQDTANSWIARNNSGQTFFGTWTVDSTATSDSVTGTWTLMNVQGATLATGKWSAAKSRAAWTGSWGAMVDGHAGAYGGTWSSSLEVSKTAPFSELFAAALRATVGGNWRFGRHSGAWSIRAY